MSELADESVSLLLETVETLVRTIAGLRARLAVLERKVEGILERKLSAGGEE